MYKFESHFLGKDDEDILIDSSEESIIATLRMAQQAIRTIDIISRPLDPVIYDTEGFVEAVKQMVIKTKKSRVRVLVHEPVQILKHGHQLLDLSLQLSSFIEIRVPGPEHEPINESLFVADRTGYIYRRDCERYEGKLNFKDKRASRLLIHEFEAIWEKSRPDLNLRRALL